MKKEAEHMSFPRRRSEIEEHLKKVGELLFELHEAYADDEEMGSLKATVI